jgi:DNA ligase 1
MLAHTYKDLKTGKIRSAPKGTIQAPDGWYASEKYDGYRAIWTGQDFVSRNGNIFVTPQWFKDWFSNDEALDGELFIGRESFEKHGILRRTIPNDDEWKKANIKFQIFDSPTLKGDFETRQLKIQKIIDDSCKKKGVGECPLKYTVQTKIRDEKHLYSIFDKLTKKGAEGVMIRSPHSPYETKRSSHLLKVKQLFDDECKIIGFQEGSGKYKGMLGAFKCQLMTNKDIKFNISGMDDTVRKNYLKTHPIGTIVTFTYMGLSVKGVPRHPNYLRIRN